MAQDGLINQLESMAMSSPFSDAGERAVPEVVDPQDAQPLRSYLRDLTDVVR
jgi:hypothetical protein